jgi:hypothetical protein
MGECRWEDDIKMNLAEIECESVNCIKLASDMVQWGSCEHDTFGFQQMKYF